MIYEWCLFFKTQLNNPVKGDWTGTVMDDLKEFRLTEDLDSIKSKSKNAFKNVVKKKAKEVALEQLQELKSKHTKMNSLEYAELKIQNYLQASWISKDQARLLFKFRTRMAPFGDNYRGGREEIICPIYDLSLLKLPLL